MNPKQRFTFAVTKIQQKSNYHFLAMFKHTTQTREYLPFGQNFLSLDFNDL